MRLVEFGGSDDLLNMNIFSGWRKLSKLMRSMELTEQEAGRSLVIKPLSDIDVTVGKTAGTPVTNHVIIVGTNGIQLSFKSPPKRIYMADELFLTCANTIFHEYNHYLQDFEQDCPEEVRVSRIGTIGNEIHYKHSWEQQPHEISVEKSGISNLWDWIKDMYPGKVRVHGVPGVPDDETVEMPLADVVILRHVNRRIKNTTYILESARYPDGLISRKAVDDAFDEAYDRSLDEPRKMLGGLASYPDEASRLVDGPGYEYFRDQFLRCSDLTGRDRDKIMATMVVHLRPDVKIHFPGVDFGDLTFEKVFGRSFPETSDESRARLGIEGEVDFGKDIKIEKSHIDRGLMYHDGNSGDFDGPEGPR